MCSGEATSFNNRTNLGNATFFEDNIHCLLEIFLRHDGVWLGMVNEEMVVFSYVQDCIGLR